MFSFRSPLFRITVFLFYVCLQFTNAAKLTQSKKAVSMRINHCSPKVLMRLKGGEDAGVTEKVPIDGPTSMDADKVKKKRKESKTRSIRAGLQFPVGRIARYIISS